MNLEPIIDALLELEQFLEDVKANYSSIVCKYRELFQTAEETNDDKLLKIS